MTGITIGGNETAPETGPYRTALLELIGTRATPGYRWEHTRDCDRERLCLLYASAHCADTLLSAPLEDRLWCWARQAVEDNRACISRSGITSDLFTRKLASNAALMAQALADRAVEQCEQIVGAHYRELWSEVHESDEADALPPVVG